MSAINEYLHLVFDTILLNPFGSVFFVVCLALVLGYILFWLKRDARRTAYVDSIKQVFLEVSVDELSEKSPLAMEQVFAAMHAIHQNFSKGEEFFEGRVVLWMSCEIVSIGGKVSYIFRMPERYRTLFESAVFAQYPKAEVSEVEDYLRNMPHLFTPEKVDFDLWGTQWNKKKPNAYPIRTYTQDASFEHGAQETFIDPLSNVIEVMSNMQPHELMAYQVVIRPVDDNWKKNVEHLIDKLKGVPEKHDMDWLLKAAHFIPDLIARILVEAVSGPPDEKKGQARVQEEPPSLMLHRSDVEKMVITAIQHGLSKIGYEVRIRTMYIAPKNKFNASLRIPEIVGAFRNFDDVVLNGIKPDIGHTWTNPSYKFFPKLERPLVERRTLTRKRHMLHYFTGRSSWRGSGTKMIMNTEELASLFHFPQIPHARVTQLEKVQAGKGAPPMDLPIG